MLIDALGLTNFRGFETHQVKFEPDVTVLVGENASGKTSIVDAVTIALGGYVGAFAEIGPTGVPRLAREDIRLARHARLDVAFALPVQISLVVSAPASTWTAGVERARVDGRATRGGSLAAYAIMLGIELGRGTMPRPLPLFARYAAGRLWHVKRAVKSKESKLRTRASGYLDALGPESNPALVAAWMKSLEVQRLQTQARIDDGRAAGDDAENANIVVAAQQAIDRALECAVPQFPGAWFDIDEARDEVWVKRDDGTSLPLWALSDGYRTLVGLVIDIAARAHRLNPQLGERVAAEVEGVVLIDEIDLHLHPKLQQTVLQRLRSAFPKLQFVVTTHAPQVIGSCEPRWLRVLKPGTAEPERVGHAKGLDVNAVLRDIMGAPYRDPASTALIANVKRAIDDEDAAAARVALDAFAALVGERDDQVVRQRWTLADLEKRHAKDT